MPDFLTPLNEYNKCHSPEDGQFCSTGGGAADIGQLRRDPAAKAAAKAAGKAAYRKEYKARAAGPAAADAVKSVGRESDRNILAGIKRHVIEDTAKGRAHGAPKAYRDKFVPAFVTEWDRRRRALGAHPLES